MDRRNGGTTKKHWLPLNAAAVAFSLAITPAEAHSELRTSQPRPGETLAVSPPEAVLVFNEDARVTAIRLADQDRQRLDLPEDVVVTGPGQVRVALPPLGPGSYEIEWRAISADGHPIRGAISFHIEGATR